MKWKKEEIEFLKTNYDKLRYGKIAKTLNRSLTSIYWKCYDLKLKRGPWPENLRWNKKKILAKLKEATVALGHSPSNRELSISLRSACQRHFGSFNKAKKKADLNIKNNLHKLPKKSYKPSKELAYILGAIMGDGSFRIQKSKERTSYVIFFQVSDKDFMDTFISKFKKWSNITPKTVFESGGIKKFPNGKYYKYRGFWSTQICSKEAYNFLKRFNDKPKYVIKFLPEIYWKWFLKGIWDAEGSITARNGYVRLLFTNSDRNILNLFKELIKKYSIKFSSYTGDAGCTTIEILGFGIIKFLGVIDGITIRRKSTKAVNESLECLRERYHGLDIKSDFYKEVYSLVKQIPFGKVSTYSSISHALMCKAYRAVGTALHKNPYSPIVPCHRVVCASGFVGDFYGGINKKIEKLQKEGIEIKKNRIDLKKYLFDFHR